jgi:hypothetical protein
MGRSGSNEDAVPLAQPFTRGQLLEVSATLCADDLGDILKSGVKGYLQV